MISYFSVDNDPLRDYTIAQWPARFDEAKKALRTMISTHQVIPVRAYDMIGHLIAPNDYPQNLQGALVQMHFMLNHYAIKGKPSSDGNPATSSVTSSNTYWSRYGFLLLVLYVLVLVVLP
jgi:hypothetical protein